MKHGISLKKMMEFQGDQVLVVMPDKNGQKPIETVYTLVHYVDGDTHDLQMVDRGSKERDTVSITQLILNNLSPIKTPNPKLPGVKWKLVLE